MMATAHARLMTAVDLTLTAPPEDPAAPIVHQVRGPDGEADMFEVRQAAVMHSVIGFMQTGFEEAKASLSEDDFLLTDEDLDGDLREKAMAACMSIISAMVEQYEEDKNQTWN